MIAPGGFPRKSGDQGDKIGVGDVVVNANARRNAICRMGQAVCRGKSW
jgi:hypothetical protein